MASGLRKVGWAAGVTLIALSACNLSGDNATPGAGPEPQPSSPEGSALVVETVESPVYDELAKRVTMVPYDGSQKAADYDLVILDGDAHTPADLANHPLVDEAVDAGKAVLIVDPTGSHKREGLGTYFGFASKEDSPAYLTRLSYDANHRAEVRVVEFPSEGTPSFTELPNTQPVSASASGAIDAFVDRALAVAGIVKISTQQGYSPYPCGGSPNTQSLGAAQVGGETIPSGAIYKHIFYCVPVSWQTGGTYKQSGSQTPFFETNYTFTIILDNGGEPQGNFQYVAAQIDVSAVPNGSSTGARPILNNADDDRGWFQHRVGVDLSPADGSIFSSVSDSPETANNSTQVQTGFQVGFTLSGSPSATGTYSNYQTVNMPDWLVRNDSSRNAKVWDFKSSSPIDADNLGDAYNTFEGDPTSVKDLNGLNTNQLQLHAQSAWRTGNVQNGWVDFNAFTVQNLANVAIFCDDSDPEEPPGCYGEQQSGSYGSPEATLSINMDAVIPVPIQSITFAQDPVLVTDSAKTTGTITLRAPAPEDIVIPLTSNSEHAVVSPTVTISQGATSTDFPVIVTTNGGSPGTTFAAVITAFYAQDFTGPINIQNVAASD